MFFPKEGDTFYSKTNAPNFSSRSLIISLNDAPRGEQVLVEPWSDSFLNGGLMGLEKRGTVFKS